MQVPLTKQGQLQRQTVLGRVFVPLRPALLARLQKHSMGWTFLQLELGGNVGHSRPARLACEQLDRLQRTVNCSLDKSHSIGNIVLDGTWLLQ
jgi:hypothetical protein